jgi:hypothetical protein
MKTLLVAALLALLFPTTANAEFLARRSGDTRAVILAAPTFKPEHAPSRVSFRETVTQAPVARGLEVDDVLAKINGAYMAGLQRCYRKTLAVDPTVSGKVDLHFVVDANGRVASALNGPGFERCLSNLMAGWRFGVALDDLGHPTAASFRISLVLSRN